MALNTVGRNTGYINVKLLQNKLEWRLILLADHRDIQQSTFLRHSIFGTQHTKSDIRSGGIVDGRS